MSSAVVARVPRGPLVLLVAGLLAWPAVAAPAPKMPPADVIPVLRKLGENRPLDATEVKRLTAWYGGESTQPPLDLDEEPDEPDEEAQWPLVAIPMVNLAQAAAPTQDEYVALVKEVRDLFGKRVDPDLRKKLDAQIAKATRPGFGADLGAMLLACRAGHVSAYATCLEALKSPTDALTANNLGAELKGMREYPRALRCLLYATRIAPSLVMAWSNLGWTQAQMGDTTTAERTFQHALSLDEGDAYANEGLAMLELARNDIRGCYHQLLATLKHAYLPGCARTMEIIGDSDVTSQAGGDGAQGGAGGNPALQPIEHPRGPGNGAPPTFSSPPDMTSVEDAIGRFDAIMAWCKQSPEQALPVIQEHNAVATRGGMARARRQDTANVRWRTYERERFVTLHLIPIFSRRCDGILREARFDELMDRAHKQADAINERCEAEKDAALKLPPEQAGPALVAALNKRCEALTALSRQTWTQFLPRWKQYRDATLKEMVDYFHFAQPWIEDVHDLDYNRELNLEREINIRANDTLTRQQLGLFLELCRALYCQEAHPQQGDGKGENKVGGSDPLDCKLANFFWKLGPISFEGNCEKLKFEAGEGAIFGAELKLGKTRNADELTIFAGVGAKASGGPLDVKVVAGGYVTLKGDMSVADVGMKEEFKAELNLGEVKIGGKLEGRIGVESGLSGKVTPCSAKLGGSTNLD